MRIDVPSVSPTVQMLCLWTVLVSLCVAPPSPVLAFYKCADTYGRITYTDRPCSLEQAQGVSASPQVQQDAVPAAPPVPETVATARRPVRRMGLDPDSPIRGKECYTHSGGTNLVLNVTHPAGKFLAVKKQATEFTSWRDDLGTRYGSKKGGANTALRAGDRLIGWAGAYEQNDREYEVTFRVKTEPPTAARQCQAEGTLVYRLGTNKKTGRVRNIRLKTGETFTMGGIPFEVGEVKPWSLQGRDGKQRMYAEIRCLKGDFRPEDYDFLETLKLYSQDGTLLEDSPNQKSTWSDAEGREGFMYNWILDELPATISLEYALWPTIQVVQVPFRVQAPMRR